jgi:hypothetical protein
LPRGTAPHHIDVMPTIDLTDEEHAAVTAAVRRSIADDKYPMAPLKSALAKLDSASIPQPQPERPPLPEAPMRSSRGGRRARR